MEGFNNFDSTTAYKTIETLTKKIADNKAINGLRYLVVKVPHGKNLDRYTAIFHSNNGENFHVAHHGFKVMG